MEFPIVVFVRCPSAIECARCRGSCSHTLR